MLSFSPHEEENPGRLDMMRIFVALLLVHASVVSRQASGAAVDRYESDRQRHTAVINLDPTKNRRVEEESRSMAATTAEYGVEGVEEDYEDYEDGYEDDLSGDYADFPRIAMVSKPKDPSTILVTERPEVQRTRRMGRKKGKGKGRKRDPCLKKYKDYCIHGTCQYKKYIRAAACVCHTSYSGERCQFFTLPVKRQEGYNRTTALAVVAVVLSSICLTIIVLLLLLRFHKRGAYDVESEEKVKLGLASNH